MLSAYVDSFTKTSNPRFLILHLYFSDFVNWRTMVVVIPSYLCPLRHNLHLKSQKLSLGKFFKNGFKSCFCKVEKISQSLNVIENILLHPALGIPRDLSPSRGINLNCQQKLAENLLLARTGKLELTFVRIFSYKGF